MTQQPTTYITPELEAQVGVERDRRVSPPVELGEIRRWAIAVYWPERPPPVYWDADYAKNTRWGGVIAPPDFNPFTWPIDEEGFNQRVEHWRRQTRRDSSTDDVGNTPGNRVLNGGSNTEYFNPIRPGDVITTVTKLASMDERQGSKTGLMLFMFSEERWTNQKDELIKINTRTTIWY